MNIALWVLSGLLAVAFTAAGSMKLAKSRSELLDAGMGWVGHATDTQVRLVGVAEVLGGLGLILPGLTGVAPVLVPLAATGLVLTMIGAIVTHVKLGDPPSAAIPAVALGVLSAVVAIGRFGPEPL